MSDRRLCGGQQNGDGDYGKSSDGENLMGDVK